MAFVRVFEALRVPFSALPFGTRSDWLFRDVVLLWKKSPNCSLIDLWDNPYLWTRTRRNSGKVYQQQLPPHKMHLCKSKGQGNREQFTDKDRNPTFLQEQLVTLLEENCWGKEGSFIIVAILLTGSTLPRELLGGIGKSLARQSYLWLSFYWN